ncbi:SGNH/GDSL hydrolase family protein [Salinisphaera sp. PC39]|uniref:SGNH/GDSL hydrolase family protein n=1 Tax=Salinisphaera sp. PC39 TaxID=1304156 RepID=UPI0033414131
MGLPATQLARPGAGLALRCAAAASLGLAPVLWFQGRGVRRRTPRVGPAAGAATGHVAGATPPLSLLTLGESPVAGWGAPDHGQAITGRLAAALARRTGRAVDWRARGRDGVTAARTRRELLPGLDPVPGGIVVAALGVNDSVGLTPPRAWRRELAGLIDDIRARLRPATIAISGVPPMHRFPALPQPLAGALGLRAALLDAIARDAAVAAGCRFVPVPRDGGPDFFCTDGFHPSPAGHARWADILAAALAPEIAPHDTDAA